MRTLITKITAVLLGLLLYSCSSESVTQEVELQDIAISFAPDSAPQAKAIVELLKSDLELLGLTRLKIVPSAALNLSFSYDDSMTKDGAFALQQNSAGYVIAATGALGWQYGAYELLERAGILFAHPEETLLPDALCMDCIEGINQTFSPVFEMRGTHVHTMHPLEYESTLLGHNEAHKTRYRKLLIWLIARKQNYLEWSLLRTVEFDAWIKYADELAAITHDRGFEIGIVAPFAFRQQNSYMLLDADSSQPFTDQIADSVDQLMQVPWDMLNVEMGASEFFSVSDKQQVEWLSFLARYLDDSYSGTRTATKVHISSDQHAENYNGINFNFLPKFADPRMGVMPHSVQFFDLYRAAPTYGQTDFSEMRGFLLDQIGKRDVFYYPETAYWVSFDNSVPIFLPQYIYARWNDLHQLQDSGMQGQINFSSGFEWGYWMNDFATAWYAYAPQDNYDAPLVRIFQQFGASESLARAIFDELILWQGKELLENNGVRWLVGWGPESDIGELVGIFTQPKRTRMHHVQEMNANELQAFEQGEFVQLDKISEKLEDMLDRWQKLENDTSRQMKPVYNEILHGMSITALRASFVKTLYEAVIAQRKADLLLSDDGGALAVDKLSAARDILSLALKVVQAEEKHYRFPKAEIAEDRESFTSYPFGYLRTVTDLWYWEREFSEASDPDNFDAFASLYDLAESGGF